MNFALSPGVYQVPLYIVTLRVADEVHSVSCIGNDGGDFLLDSVHLVPHSHKAILQNIAPGQSAHTSAASIILTREVPLLDNKGSTVLPYST